MDRLSPTLIALSTGLCLAGCVSAPLLESRLANYENASEADVIASFGPPARIFVDDEGFKVLVYGKRGLLQRPDCEATFLIKDAQVKRWNWAGRRCQTFAEGDEFRPAPDDGS